MKATYAQIESALNNTFGFGVDNAQNKYDGIRACENKAIIKVTTKVKKTSNHFSKSDWKKVHTEIKKMLA